MAGINLFGVHLYIIYELIYKLLWRENQYINDFIIFTNILHKTIMAKCILVCSTSSIEICIHPIMFDRYLQNAITFYSHCNQVSLIETQHIDQGAMEISAECSRVVTLKTSLRSYHRWVAKGNILS